jgi:alkylhydroperoxidase family enzyme
VDSVSEDARIPRLSVEEARAAAEGAGVLPLFADLSVFQVVLRNPVLAKAMQDLLIALLARGELDARLRELVIMRIGWRTGSVYEWTQHWKVARDLGVSADDLVGVRDWTAHAGFGPSERAVLAATDEVLDVDTIGAETWAACAAALDDEDALLELPIVIAHWHMYSQLLQSLDVPLEDGTEPWPPDGAVGPGG